MKAERIFLVGKLHSKEVGCDTLYIKTLQSVLEDSVIRHIIVKPIPSHIIDTPLVEPLQEDWQPRKKVPNLGLKLRSILKASPQVPGSFVHSKDPFQVLFLRKGTVIENITFESGKGLVYIDSTSKVIGEIKGGGRFLDYASSQYKASPKKAPSTPIKAEHTLRSPVKPSRR